MSKNANVLFVDDEERILRLLGIMFRGQYNVLTAASGAAALEVVKKHDIHVIVSDQRMPGMTGIELLAEVRKLSPETVRLLLTGYSDLVAIIGAVNEGEVYRFLNKPWEQEELKSVLADSVEVALAARAAADARASAKTDEVKELASAAKLLAIDGVRATRHEIMEIFTEDFAVLGASTIAEAREILMMHDVGVIITDTEVAGEDATTLLRELRIRYPAVTIVLLTNVADCNTIIDLINQSGIYRFAMRPLAPNIFRLAVSAAMKEHHRRLADPRVMRRVSNGAIGSEHDMAKDLAGGIVESLGRFTTIS